MRRFISIVVFFLYLVGCGGSSSARLEPALIDRGERFEWTVDGVTVTADVDSWDGDPAVRERVTPVVVTINNRSDRPIRVQYSQFSLVSPRGRCFSVLPPYPMEGTVAEPLFVDAAPIAAPSFAFELFEVAPHFAALYPSLEVYDGPFFADPGYYDTYHQAWRGLELPTPEMLSTMLPEGVLAPGGMVSGTLYFERVDSVERVALVADLVSAGEGERFGMVALPFVAARR